MDKFDFNGKKVLVTGASSGVGREVAILLSAMGAKVVIVARREAELQKTLSLMEGSGHSYRVVDLADFDKVVSTIKEIVISGRDEVADTERLCPVVSMAGLRCTLVNSPSVFLFATFWLLTAPSGFFTDFFSLSDRSTTTGV